MRKWLHKIFDSLCDKYFFVAMDYPGDTLPWWYRIIDDIEFYLREKE